MKQENNFNNANFNGPTQIGEKNINIQGDKINIHQYSHTDDQLNNKKLELYQAEPKWRSPFTLAVLTWTGVLLSIAGIVPMIYQLIFNIYDNLHSRVTQDNTFIYFIVLIVCLFMLLFIWKLRKITKEQIRLPLFFNYALNGKDNILTLEKIYPNKCPECGGKMKYYNKPYKWIDIYDSNGNWKKRNITERVPALECTRNPKHFWLIDPAEDKI